MKTAVKPDFYAAIESLKRNEAAKKKGTSTEEQAYYAMSLSDGWKQFSTLKDELLRELEQINDTAVAQGASYEELGKNTIVISLVKGVVKRLFDRVGDATEACEGREGTA